MLPLFKIGIYFLSFSMNNAKRCPALHVLQREATEHALMRLVAVVYAAVGILFILSLFAHV